MFKYAMEIRKSKNGFLVFPRHNFNDPGRGFAFGEMMVFEKIDALLDFVKKEMTEESPAS